MDTLRSNFAGKMWHRVRLFLELIRFSHTVFALPFAILAALLAWQKTPFQWQHGLGILLCMIFARSAAMAFNRLADRTIDATNPRTASRHLPSGLLSTTAVGSFIVLCSLGFVTSTLLFLPNRWPMYLAVPVLAILLVYSYMKRVTVWCHYWLALALMISPVAAWIAIRGMVEPPPLLLAGVIFFWVGGFDIIYACQDIEFDKQAGLFSVPTWLGIGGALKLAFVSHLITIVFLFAFWWYTGLSYVFLVGVVLVAGLLLYEHRLVHPDNLSRVNVAFFNVNAVISIGLLAFAVVDLLIMGMS